MDCPDCGRPVAVVRATCFYCGKPLPSGVVAAARTTAEKALRDLESAPPAAAEASTTLGAAPPSEDRSLLIIDLREASADAVAAALQTSAFEAGQRLKRGGYQLHRIARAGDAVAEAERIAGHGVRVFTLSEADLRRHAPVGIGRGRLEPQRFVGRVAGRSLECPVNDVLLVVRGPIRREFQAQDKNLKQLKSAAPSEGYRFHLHRVSDPRPLEIDPNAFEFEDREASVSSFLRVAQWIDSLAPAPPLDDGFRLMPPALGESERDRTTAHALGRGPQKDGERPLLDNLKQFRLYSSWRGAVERIVRGYG